ncbi:ECF transporter S component [Microbacterium galbinum]|uniref:ECF transporter S component n=1 Tax=Microbacterium galbinum TaxID=2851646 RepID=UPI001FFD1248|nr:ECF transporter S component [Microbacterium galbinum]
MSTSTPESAAKNTGETASNPASGSNPASAAKQASAKSAPVTIWRWRVVDIVVASVLGVAAGLIFLAWNVGYLGPKALLEPLLPGLQGLLDGPWLFAGVLGGLIIRKAGAAIYVELLAAVVSALIGNQWGGFLTLEAGLVQGLGAELIFLLFFYRRWSLPVAILAGAGAALAGGINNLILWYAGSGTEFTVIYLISTVVSGAVIAGALSWVLARGIAATGALDRFGSGREARVRV